MGPLRNLLNLVWRYLSGSQDPSWAGFSLWGGAPNWDVPPYIGNTRISPHGATDDLRRGGLSWAGAHLLLVAVLTWDVAIPRV